MKKICRNMKHYLQTYPRTSALVILIPLLGTIYLYGTRVIIPNLEKINLVEISDFLTNPGNLIFFGIYILFGILLVSIFSSLEAIIYTVEIKTSKIKNYGTFVGIIFLLISGVVIVFAQKEVGIQHINYKLLIYAQSCSPFPAVIVEIILNEIKKKKQKNQNSSDIIEERVEKMYKN